MTQEIICPVKNKKVNITYVEIPSSTLEDRNASVVYGRRECSDNDYRCDYSKCPLEKNKQ